MREDQTSGATAGAPSLSVSDRLSEQAWAKETATGILTVVGTTQEDPPGITNLARQYLSLARQWESVPGDLFDSTLDPGAGEAWRQAYIDRMSEAVNAAREADRYREALNLALMHLEDPRAIEAVRAALDTGESPDSPPKDGVSP